VDCIKDHMAPGSYLAVSHVTGDDIPPDALQQAHAVYEKASAPGVARERDDIDRFFDGLVMLAPGLVNVPDWRPDHIVRKPRETFFYAGIGRKPAGTAESLP
jgi:S-adenosyl methyltransferase